MPERGTLDISKAKNLINYTPEYVLSKGYLKYINWYKTFFAKNNILTQKKSVNLGSQINE